MNVILIFHGNLELAKIFLEMNNDYTQTTLIDIEFITMQFSVILLVINTYFAVCLENKTNPLMKYCQFGINHLLCPNRPKPSCDKNFSVRLPKFDKHVLHERINTIRSNFAYGLNSKGIDQRAIKAMNMKEMVKYISDLVLYCPSDC